MNPRIQKGKETRKRRKQLRCRVFELKIKFKKANKRTKEHLERLFLENKWFYNSVVANFRKGNYKIDTKAKEVQVKVGDNIETRPLLALSSQMKQAVVQGWKRLLRLLGQIPVISVEIIKISAEPPVLSGVFGTPSYEQRTGEQRLTLPPNRFVLVPKKVFRVGTLVKVNAARRLNLSNAMLFCYRDYEKIVELDDDNKMLRETGIGEYWAVTAAMWAEGKSFSYEYEICRKGEPRMLEKCERGHIYPTSTAKKYISFWHAVDWKKVIEDNRYWI